MPRRLQYIDLDPRQLRIDTALTPRREIVVKDCRARGLNTEDAMVRSRWRKQIGMIDDHDECEWVTVSSGTGSPGLSQTNSTEP